MNRMYEYHSLMQELESTVPELEHTLERARRKVRRNRIIRPAIHIAATFVIFVMLVNFCTPVAYACSKVPILRELAKAVTFSRSLSDAVDNEYVQTLSLWQEDGEVTASVEYLIVDQKQVNIFFRLDSERYSKLGADPTVLLADGNRPEACSYGLNDWDIPNGELQSITIDFVDGDVPDSLHLKLDIRDVGNTHYGAVAEMAPESSVDAMFEDVEAEAPEYIAHFDFLLEFDPEFTATGKVYTINETVVLDGQEITFTKLEVYPTHLRVNVEDSADNTAWLKMLNFYIKTDWGMKFDTISNGITATGSADSPAMASFRADSPYFYDANHLELVITGAEWLNKDMGKVYVNLQTGETGKLPEGVAFDSATREADGWLVEFKADYRKPDFHHQVFSSKYYDAEGKEYNINSWSTRFGEENTDGETLYFIESLPLKGYSSEEVWLCPHYSHVWMAEEPITVLVK